MSYSGSTHALGACSPSSILGTPTGDKIFYATAPDTMYNKRMKDAILSFPQQFAYRPQINNAGSFKPRKEFVVAGMGGSHLAADLITMWRPEAPLIIHSDYGLPNLPKDKLKNSLIIANSYSGNTEETLSAFHAARKLKIPLIAVSTGGKLLALAKKHGVPYIETPGGKTEPRAAIGFNFMALLKAIGRNKDISLAAKLEKQLSPEKEESAGEKIAKAIGKKSLIIYSSGRNYPLAYNWKINMNETAKSPAFADVFPELNHNEMNAFAAKAAKQPEFYFLILRSGEDYSRTQARMAVLKRLLKDRSWPVEEIYLGKSGTLKDVFQNVLLSMWNSTYIAEEKKIDPDKTPIIEEFKRLISE